MCCGAAQSQRVKELEDLLKTIQDQVAKAPVSKSEASEGTVSLDSQVSRLIAQHQDLVKEVANLKDAKSDLQVSFQLSYKVPRRAWSGS